MVFNFIKLVLDVDISLIPISPPLCGFLSADDGKHNGARTHPHQAQVVMVIRSHKREVVEGVNLKYLT